MQIKKIILKFSYLIWGIIKYIAIVLVFSFIVLIFSRIVHIWFYRAVIIGAGIAALFILNLVFEDKEKERYFLIIPLKFEAAALLFTRWLSNEGFIAISGFDTKDLEWLKKEKREKTRVYNFYNLFDQYTVVSENILQDGLRKTIDVFFSDEIKRLSEVSDVPIYYIAKEHSLEVYEVYFKGQQEKKLAFATHAASCIEEFKEQGKDVEKGEIKRRDYFSMGDYIKGLNFPLEIHKTNIRRMIKSSIYKARVLFRNDK